MAAWRLPRLKGMIQQWRLSRLRREGLTIGDDCSLGTLGAFPDFGSEPYLVSVGNRVAFAAGVVFITHDGGTAAINQKPPYTRVIKYDRVTIHDNCVIGRNVILMPGAEVGPNSVVGAGAVVTRATPPNSVIAGNPARVLMSIEAYGEQCLVSTPDYDPVAYRRDKRTELLRLFPPHR